jgi:hypothetical protein
MPVPRRRAKNLRGPLSDQEVLELRMGGPAPGQPSVFDNASEYLHARARLAEQEPLWDEIDRHLHEQQLTEERFRRHMAAGHPPINPEYPALVDTTACRLCQGVTEDA